MMRMNNEQLYAKQTVLIIDDLVKSQKITNRRRQLNKLRGELSENLDFLRDRQDSG